MLVLSRKSGQCIVIGDNIKICVLEMKGKQVRLGIEAPSKYSVHREELYEKVQIQNQNAANQTPRSLKSFIHFFNHLSN